MYQSFDCGSYVGAGNGYVPMPTDRESIAQALRTLTDIPFKPVNCKDGPVAVYTGKISVSQMDRLNYVAKECGIVFRNKIPGDAASPDIHQLCIDQCKDLSRLEALAGREEERRQTEAEAVEPLSHLTGGHMWAWDGLSLSTLLPPSNTRQHVTLHGKLDHLVRKGVFTGENDLAKFTSHNADGQKTEWVTAHAVNMKELQSLYQSHAQGMSL